jgi:hypothetical protein
MLAVSRRWQIDPYTGTLAPVFLELTVMAGLYGVTNPADPSPILAYCERRGYALLRDDQYDYIRQAVSGLSTPDNTLYFYLFSFDDCITDRRTGSTRIVRNVERYGDFINTIVSDGVNGDCSLDDLDSLINFWMISADRANESDTVQNRRARKQAIQNLRYLVDTVNSAQLTDEFGNPVEYEIGHYVTLTAEDMQGLQG